MSGTLDFEEELKSAIGVQEYEILKPTIQESQLLYQNAKYYYSVNEFVGALVSYSCASVLINSTITRLETSKINVDNDSDKQKIIQTIMDKANNILECCLESVEELQQKVSIASSGEKKNENKEKWAKRCLSIQPLVLSGKSCIYYDDVIGLYKEKAQINAAFISPLMYPNLFPKTSKGILLFGPPGTGKTLLVKAAVNELQKKGGSQVGVFYFAPSPADLKGKYVGETEKKIEEWFTCASVAACQSENNADCKPKKFISIIFIDEMDSIAGDRSNDPTGLNSNSVNTLLQMMDGISSKENVAVIGVTNYPWTLDSAIIRRFDTQILVGLPKITEIQELLDYEMNISLNLKKKISKFCESTNFDKEETNDNDTKAISCGVACTDNTPAEKLILGEFYKKFIIEYYNDNNNINTNILSQVKGIVTKLYDEGFTNSDIARFFRTALRHTGELTIETSLFYKTGLVGDTEKPEKYMSAVTQMSNKKIGIELSIKILKELHNTESKKSDIPVYHDKPPEISVIQFDGYNYYNIKCILCKDNDMLLNHRLLRGIYIRGNKKGTEFTEKTYEDAFFKTTGKAEAGISKVSNTVVDNLGKVGVAAAAAGVGVGVVANKFGIAESIGGGIGIFGLTYFGGSKAEYIAKFLAQSADDLVGGADKDIIIEFDVNFEKIDTPSGGGNTSTQTLISKSNVWCFFTSFMEMYNSIYKGSKDEAARVLGTYKDAKLADGKPIFSDNEKNEFIALTNKDDSIFYAPGNLVTRFLKEKFLDDHKSFTDCFKELEKGEYYSLYNYLLLLNVFKSTLITDTGKQYFNENILREVVDADKQGDFKEEKEYPIYGTDQTIKLTFKERNEAEVKENGPRDIIISVKDYIKIIPYYEDYKLTAVQSVDIDDNNKYLIMDFSVFIRLFRRTIFINDVADDDSLKKIELQEQQNDKDQHFTYCLIQLYMNGVYKHVSNYNNLTDYKTSTFVLRKFSEIFFINNANLSGLSRQVNNTNSSKSAITAQYPVVQSILKKIVNYFRPYKEKLDGGAEKKESSEKKLQNVLIEEKKIINELKDSDKSLDDIIKDLETEKQKIELKKKKLNTEEEKTLTELNNVLNIALIELKNLEQPIPTSQDKQALSQEIILKPENNAPIDEKLEYIKSAELFNQDTDENNTDLKSNYDMLYDYVALFYEYYLDIDTGSKDLEKFEKLFFDNLAEKNYYKVVKKEFETNTILNTKGRFLNSWNIQLETAVKSKKFDKFETIVTNKAIQQVFDPAGEIRIKNNNGGGLTITNQNELDAIFNGLFDNIYLEYYGNIEGCLHPGAETGAETNFTDYEKFKTEFKKNITNKENKTKKIIKYYDEQIQHINSVNTTNGEIKKKRIFIASQFNFLRIQQLIKSNIFSSLWSGSKGMYAYVKSFFVTTATYSTEDAQKKNILEMLDELKNRNLLLSTIFKDVRAFGFQKITDPKDTIKIIIENDDYSSTTTNKEIEWSYLSNYDTSGTAIGNTERGFKKLTKNILSANPEAVNLMIAHVSDLISPFRVYQWIAGLILKIISSSVPSFVGYENAVLTAIFTILSAVGGIAAFYSGAGALSGAFGAAVLGFATGSSAVGAGVAAGVAALVGYFWTPDIGTCLNSFFDFSNENSTGTQNMKLLTGAFTYIFEKISNLFIISPSLDSGDNTKLTTGISEIITKQFAKIGITGLSFTSIFSNVSTFITTTYTSLKTVLTGLSSGQKIAIILTIGQIYSFATRNLDDEKMINNNFLYQMFNIITLSGKIKVNSFSKSPNDAILSYIKSEMKQNGSLGTLSYMYNVPYNTLIMGETKNKKSYKLTLFNKKNQGNVSPYSLVNLNIPISSFIYAFNEVKATADKDLTGKLNEYYENKDTFMEKRKQELQGKKK
jgi:SpoVK/Ycf46/Vps4 family AAA+-type ATPase